MKMAEKQEVDQSQFLVSELSTRISELEQRNGNLRERVLLLGTNLIESKEETEKILNELRLDSEKNERDLDKIKTTINGVISEMDNFVRKDEMAIVERMLKDFQPLDFVRRKDLDEALGKEIKTTKKSK